MPITCNERINSPSITHGENVSIEVTYVLKGSTDPEDVLDALAATAPTTYALGSTNYARQSYRVEPEGDDVWNGTVSYGASGSTPGGTGEVGDSSYSFDTGGGTQHITQSKETVETSGMGSGTPVPDFHNAIGFDGASISGVDVVIPQYQFTETHIMSHSGVDSAYKVTVANLTGKINDASFKGFDAGTVLFLGANGTRTGTEKWTVTFKFAYSPNIANYCINPGADPSEQISVSLKGGWEYAWVLYEDVAGNSQIIKRPKALYIERIYDSGDFSELGIGT